MKGVCCRNHTSGRLFATKLGDLFVSNAFNDCEKDVSVASLGWTEITTSLARYAMRAAVAVLS
jgi:hypothetical protein